MLPVTLPTKIGKRSKYRAIKTVVDGITFDSKIESRRYGELKLLEAAGEITHLELQPVYKITINGKLICKVQPDFRYYTIQTPEKRGECIVEDVKSPVTMKNRAYRIKKKLLEASYPGVVIVEITR